ncbi:hypothetical protein WOLCODRAFT_117962 [Wolfiporia cocos MD-104 SS10]|uniref:Cytochrome c oxidase assembly factor 3 n=1 Tax=Wolfiporia cocos (strain MD-104) TaxID=742152 RepID=A0A2H3JHA0_WOLCO|nr:hypothetical protein WOLCODRAFT_117962 [Wolfiporia cocos MD-104 SS10]
MADPYISRRVAGASYRPNNIMSPGLKRARAPFLMRNIITGGVLVAFTASVWAYSISAVKQDEFADVDEEARALARAREQSLVEHEAERRAAEDAAEGAAVPAAPATSTVQPAQRAPSIASVSTAGRGVLPALLDSRFPRLLDPSTKTLVWGAPSVDSIGKLWDGTRRQP